MNIQPYYINLDGRTDRVAQFLQDYPETLPPPIRFSATRANPSAHGCWISHKRLIREMIDAKVEVGLVFEDDAFPRTGFDELWPQFLDALPNNMVFAYLGGYYIEGRQPRKVNKMVRVPGGVLASHCYLIHRSFMPTVYQWLDTGPLGHIDHHYKRKFTETKIEGYYCSGKQLFGQRGGWSDVENFVRPADLTWQDPDDMRDIAFRPGKQPCDQDEKGVCRRRRCGLVNSDVCRIGIGTVRVEVT